ncbi:hypothetical protein [Agriterribacter sp.]|uniref:hypothetical protein n=1 Tax=Agriterribacter sp. TaxID=2821509 RepID=UPI002C28CFF5|nr:hypothetical protein [Agriterribacter sp.]HRP56298.1 hypothetical protein [Agriterribacter sp.]
MNEILLFLLIAFTLVTFVSLNKKTGSAGPFPGDILSKRAGAYPVGGMARVIYSGVIKKAQYDYSRLWSVTAIAGIATGTANLQNELTIVYHQPGNSARLQPYYLPSGESRGFDAADNKRNSLLLCDDVCVISSVSDFQYRHVLLGDGAA